MYKIILKKLIRITTIPLSLEKLLEGQLAFMSAFYKVTAVSADKEGLEKIRGKEVVKIFEIPLTRKITPIKDLIAVFNLYKFLKKEKPLIVHTHTPKAGIVGMMAAYLARVPIRIHTVAGLPLLEATGIKRKVLDFVEKLTYKFATNVFPNSFGLKGIILKNKFTITTKLKVIGAGSSNGINTQYFSRSHFSKEELVQKKVELHIPQEDFVFVFVGRIVKDKGINKLIEAFNKLQNTSLLTTHFSLLLVGPFEDDLDPISEKTRKIISENPKIISTGYQEEVRIFYAISDVLVFPSYREGFPNVVMQAGAMGLPSIVTDINGCNEIIQENKNGWIIPVKDSDAIYRAMQNCLVNQQQVKEMASQSREMITSRYEQKKVWEAILEEYQKLEKEFNNRNS